MNKRDAYTAGYDAGTAAARHCETGHDYDKREAGCPCPHDDRSEYCPDCLTTAAFESERNARCFSPFEHLAHEMNTAGERSEGLWEAYDNGVARGVEIESQRRMRGLLTTKRNHITLITEFLSSLGVSKLAQFTRVVDDITKNEVTEFTIEALMDLMNDGNRSMGLATMRSFLNEIEARWDSGRRR